MTELTLQDGEMTADKRGVRFHVATSNAGEARRVGIKAIESVGIGSVDHVGRDGPRCSVYLKADAPQELLARINESLGVGV